jgi:hypothetical protein
MTRRRVPATHARKRKCTGDQRESLQEKWHETASMGGATDTRCEDRVEVEVRHRMGVMEVKCRIGACQGHVEG